MGRSRGIDGCRAVAATLIVVFHSWGFAGHNPGGLGWLMARMWIGVPFFFALSGFLLYRPFARATLNGTAAPRIGRYARQRIARIVPGYWFAALVSLGVVGGGILHVNRSSVAIDLVFGQIYRAPSPPPLVAPAWTLCLEVLFYATLPGIAWAITKASRRSAARMLGLLAVMAALGLSLVQIGIPVELSFLAQQQFAFGMMAAVIIERGWAVPRWAGLAGAASVLVILPFAPITNSGNPVVSVMLSAGFALVVLHVANRHSTVLASRPLAALGVVSYGLFLWHYQVLLVVSQQTDSLPVLMAITLSVTLLFAVLSWYAIERPAIHLSHKRPAVGAPAPAEPMPASDAISVG